MKNILCLLAAALFCGCNKPVAPPVQKWEYSNFKYHEPEFDNSRTFMTECYIEFSDGNFHWENSNTVTSVDLLLNQIGNFGWEIAWTDGTNFIVKRPTDIFTNGTFIVEETTVSVK
jgi:hypothetical protein